MKSTPVWATSRTRSRLILPEASKQGAASYQLDRGPHVSGRHIVQQQDVGLGRQCLADLFQAGTFDLNPQQGRGSLPGLTDGRPDPARTTLM